jgi:hypothetical protein
MKTLVEQQTTSARLHCYGDHDSVKHDVVTLAEALRRRGFPLHTLKLSEASAANAATTLVAWSDSSSVPFVAGEPRHYIGMAAVLFSFGAVRLVDPSSGWCKLIATEYAVCVEITKDQWGVPKIELTIMCPC